MLKLKPLLLVLAMWASLFSLAHGKEFVSSPGDYKVDFPEAPTESITVLAGNTLVRQTVWQTGSSAIIISVESFQSVKLRSVGAKEYFKATEDQIKAAMSKRTVTTKSLTHRTQNGRELQVGSAQDDDKLRVRLFFNDRAGYKLLAVGGKEFMNSDLVSTFFDSFTLLKSDPVESSRFVPLVDSTAKFKAMVLAHARGLAGRPNASTKEILNVIGANGPTQYYGILHQDAAGIRQSDSRQLDNLTKTAINQFTDGDGDGYRQTSVRQLLQAGVEGTEHAYRMDSDRSRLLARRFVNNERVYWLFVGWKEGREDPSLASKFLDGFTFIR